MKSFVPSNTHSWYTPSKVDFATKNKKSVKHILNLKKTYRAKQTIKVEYCRVYRKNQRFILVYIIFLFHLVYESHRLAFLLISIDFPISVYCFTFNYWVDQCQLCNLDIKTQNTTTTNDKLIQAIWNECLY